MKVNLVKDAKGKVVATFENAAAGSPSLQPVLEAGQTLHEIDVAANYKDDIDGFYRRHSR